MSSSSIILASLSLSQALDRWHNLDPRKREMLIGFGAVAVMTLFLVGLLLMQTREGRHHHHHHHSHDHDEAAASAAQNGDESGQTRRKWRRRRRSHRPRNPTLAETGGLPPLRSQAEPPSSESRP